MTINNNCDSYFDFLTSEEIEEWARIRDAIKMSSSSNKIPEIYTEQINFMQTLNIKYKVYFTVIGFDSYIKARRRADKLSGILDNNPNNVGSPVRC
jgi:hypothetical protein